MVKLSSICDFNQKKEIFKYGTSKPDNYSASVQKEFA